MEIKYIYWIAGILEGEGCFGVTNAGRSPVIYLDMTDEDTVFKVAKLIDNNATIRTMQDKREPQYKTKYRVSFHGHQARGWMMTIYPLMSNRRQQKIKELLTDWKNSPSREINDSPKAKHKALIKRLARRYSTTFSMAKWMLRNNPQLAER